jgi:hypothetical protein
MNLQDAIREAESLLPGEPVEKGPDPRWQAIIRVGEYIESEPAPIWEFIRRWASHPQEDLRNALATCLLEHLLEHHFAAYFPQAEQAALTDPLFADTFQRCWPFGLEPREVKRFVTLQKRFG